MRSAGPARPRSGRGGPRLRSQPGPGRRDVDLLRFRARDDHGAERRLRPRALRRQTPRRLRQLAEVRHAVGAVRVEPADQHHRDGRVLVRRQPRRALAQGVPLEVLGRKRVRPGRRIRAGLGLEKNKFNTTTFARSPARPSSGSNWIPTARFRPASWNGGSTTPASRPTSPRPSTAGVDRVVVVSDKTYLSGTARDDGKATRRRSVSWSKESGPGNVTFANAESAATTASFSAVGEYVLKLTADDGQLSAADTLSVVVDPPPPAEHLLPVATNTYKINSPLWNDRIKKLIVNWIPHCYNKISDPNVAEGGIENFTQAGNKLAGRPHTGHKGPVFANAWVHNTVEAMCVALMVDPQGDQELIQAQKAIRDKLERLDSQAPQRPGTRRLPADVLHAPGPAALDEQARPRGLPGRLLHRIRHRPLPDDRQNGRPDVRGGQAIGRLLVRQHRPAAEEATGTKAIRSWSRPWCGSPGSSTTSKGPAKAGSTSNWPSS